MTREHDFRCTLPSGLHARPASLLSELADCFASDVELTNRRTGAKANAKSVLETVAIAVKSGDACTLRCSGADAESAHAALREFVENVLPGCDEPPPPAHDKEAVALPRNKKLVVTIGTRSANGDYEGTIPRSGGGSPQTGSGQPITIGQIKLKLAVLRHATFH